MNLFIIASLCFFIFNLLLNALILLMRFLSLDRGIRHTTELVAAINNGKYRDLLDFIGLVRLYFIRSSPPYILIFTTIFIYACWLIFTSIIFSWWNLLINLIIFIIFTFLFAITILTNLVIVWFYRKKLRNICELFISFKAPKTNPSINLLNLQILEDSKKSKILSKVFSKKLTIVRKIFLSEQEIQTKKEARFFLSGIAYLLIEMMGRCILYWEGKIDYSDREFFSFAYNPITSGFVFSNLSFRSLLNGKTIEKNEVYKMYCSFCSKFILPKELLNFIYKPTKSIARIKSLREHETSQTYFD